MTAKELIVLINDQVIRQATQGNSGRFDFRYADAWLSNPSAVPLSLSMPLAKGCA
jgi:HipA-like protein